MGARASWTAGDRFFVWGTGIGSAVLFAAAAALPGGDAWSRIGLVATGVLVGIPALRVVAARQRGETTPQPIAHRSLGQNLAGAATIIGWFLIPWVFGFWEQTGLIGQSALFAFGFVGFVLADQVSRRWPAEGILEWQEHRRR